MIEPGDHHLIFDCLFGAGEEGEVKIELRSAGQPELISINHGFSRLLADCTISGIRGPLEY